MHYTDKEALLAGATMIRKGDDEDPASIVTKALDDLSKTVNERIDTDTKALNERLDMLETKINRPAITVDRKDERVEIERKALNTFLRGGFAALNEVERKALTIGGSPATGASVVAPEYSSTIIAKLTQYSPMRSVASVMSIGGGEVYLPRNTGVLAGGWVTETGSRAESQPSFDQVNIKVFEHAVIVPVSRQLLEDSFIDLQAYLAGQIGEQFAKAEATAFVNGDGNGKPTGFMNAPGSFAQVTADQDGSDIIEAVIDAFYKLPAAYAANGSWFMNRTTQGVIRKAADTTTKGTLWSDSLANGTPPMLLGRPVYDAVDMGNLAGSGSPVADTYPVAFGDFASAYRIVDHVGVEIMRDDYTGADNGIVKFRARRRVGGKVVSAEPVVLIKATAI